MLIFYLFEKSLKDEHETQLRNLKEEYEIKIRAIEVNFYCLGLDLKTQIIFDKI